MYVYTQPNDFTAFGRWKDSRRYWTAMTIYNIAISYNTPIGTCDTYFNELRYRRIVNTSMKLRLNTGNRTSLSLFLFLKLDNTIYLTREQTAVQHFSK